MRSIIRFSLNNDNGTFGGKLRQLLEGHGYTLRENTSTYENQNIAVSDLADAMSAFWGLASKPPIVPDQTTREMKQVKLDHVWTYSD